MNSNRMLTMALYLLLGGLVAVFGYRACQLKKEQTAKLAEQAEMEQTLRDMGYESDQAERSGVAKPSDLTDTKTTTPAPTASTTTTTTTTTTPAATTAAAPKTAEPKAAVTAPKPVESSTETKAVPTKKMVDRNDETIADKPALKTTKAPVKSLTAKGVSTKTAAPSKPAYAVIAASFSKKENARNVMEALVKKGFTNAEISPKGKYWAVISDRAATKEAAAKMVELVNKQPDCAKAYVYKRP